MLKKSATDRAIEIAQDRAKRLALASAQLDARLDADRERRATKIMDDAAMARSMNLTGETDAMVEARRFHGERIQARRKANTPWDHDGLAYYVSN